MTGHGHVQQDRLEGVSPLGGGGHGCDRLVRGVDRDRADAPPAELLGEDRPVVRVVVDDEHPSTGEDLSRVRVGGVVDLAGRRLEQDAEGEDRTAVGVVAVADGAAHRLHDLAADGQAETGAAVDAGGRGVGLGEGLEETGDLGRRDADAGVADGHAQVGPLVRPGLRGRADQDLALLGELDGVGDQVGQDLGEARGVAGEHLRHLGRAGHDQLQAT